MDSGPETIQICAYTNLLSDIDTDTSTTPLSPETNTKQNQLHEITFQWLALPDIHSDLFRKRNWLNDKCQVFEIQRWLKRDSGWVIKVIPFTATSESDNRCHLLQ